jgi:hypothetical protein
MPPSRFIPSGFAPASDITLSWATFTAAATEAGMAGLYGGIQFRSSVTQGSQLGQMIGDKVFAKYQSLLSQSKDGPPTDSSQQSSSPISIRTWWVVLLIGVGGAVVIVVPLVLLIHRVLRKRDAIKLPNNPEPFPAVGDNNGNARRD